MKITREYPQVTITDKGARFVARHPWLYEGEVVSIEGTYQNGDLVDVVSLKGKYIGSGFISNNSKIRVRIFCRNTSDTINEEYFKRKIRYAWNYRKDVLDSVEACRVIFGEADGLPGVTIDKFNNVFVSEIVSYGMDKIKDVLYKGLMEVMQEDGIKVDAIFERNDIAIRELEGLAKYDAFYYQAPNYSDEEVIIEENGIKYYVDYVNGQKTGFFLDQKYNRRLVAELARGKKVLDCFTHTGSFALNAAYGKASKVTAVDISETAIEMAKRNAKLNNLNINFEVADIFDYLGKVNKKEYDIIILDPPAFTKSRSTIKNAYNGYKQINAMAMKLLGKGGYLVTCSCSHFMNQQLFEEMLLDAAKEINVELKQVSFTQQAKDHPILLNVEETNYLKFYIFQIC